jgi:tetratricopeptide (TPR) repeat protein
MAILAFLLGCVEMFDTDVWWHVRGGEWILAHRRVPRLDPFTFSSADRPWIDLHWGFQVILAQVHAVGGVAAMILMASGVCTLAFLFAALARRRSWPLWVGLGCWLPALLLMSTRFDPRPECFSLLFTGVLLAILLRVEVSPAWSWSLPVVMLIWVNTHALFAIGIVIIGGYVGSRLIESLASPRANPRLTDGRGVSPWRHLVPATLLAGMACLANPYGISGALFPLELLPKIASSSSAYKQLADEVMSLSMRLKRESVTGVSGRIYLIAHLFLLTVLPLSFVFPAIWQRWKSTNAGSRSRVMIWAGVFLVAVAVVFMASLSLPGNRVPGWLVRAAYFAPALLGVGGFLAAARLFASARGAAILAGAGAVACAGWLDWLHGHLFGPGNSLIDWGTGAGSFRPIFAALAVGGPTVMLLLRAGVAPFRLFLAVVFGYLGLTADRNSGLFGLVGGAVLAWNVSEWAASLAADGDAHRVKRVAAWCGRIGVAVVLGAWLFLVSTDRFYPLTGYLLHGGLRERPLTFAHDAARFAGGEGLPDRALVFDLGQTGVYVYHNAPKRKIFVDARLEVPTLKTLETYQLADTLLNRGDPRALAVVSGIGDPLIMLDHQSNGRAEATLVATHSYRCVYWDPVASVFIPRARRDLEKRYPTVDFGGRHFAVAGRLGPKRNPEDDYAEARSLLELATTLSGRVPATAAVRLGAALLSQRLTREALASRPGWSAAWTVLGHGTRLLYPDSAGRPPGPNDPWDPATALPWAASTYCFQQTLATNPENRAALLSLRDSYKLRRMSDAQSDAEAALVKPDSQRASPRSGLLPERGGRLEWENPKQVLEVVNDALQHSGAVAVSRIATASLARSEGLPWSLAEHLAVSAMHLGDPVTARLIWERSLDAPSESLRNARVGDACIALFDFQGAATSYRRAIELDPRLGVAWYGMALAHTLEGSAGEAVSACRSGLALTLSVAQRERLQSIVELASGTATQVGIGKASSDPP